MSPRPDALVRRVRCPNCGSAMTRVYRSLPASDNGSRVQYRRCLICPCRFKTVREPAEVRLPTDRPPPRRRKRRRRRA